MRRDNRERTSTPRPPNETPETTRLAIRDTGTRIHPEVSA